MRPAIRLQTAGDLPPCSSGNMASQQLLSGLDYGRRLDRNQTLIRTVDMAGVVHAVRTAQHDAACAEGTVALRTRGSEQGDHRNAQRGCKVHRTRVSSDEESGAARERNQFSDRA